MVVKSTWDYAYYWGVLSWLYFRDVLTDLSFLRAAQTDLMRIRQLNCDMQARFRHRAESRIVDRGSGRFFDQVEIPILARLNAELLQPGGSLENKLMENCRRLDVLAPDLLHMLTAETSVRRTELLGDLGQRFN